MTQKIYHGNFRNSDLVQAILAEFDHGNLHVQQIGDGDSIIVQIATSEFSNAGGKTAINISLMNITDGVAVEVGKQAWLGIAASLGLSTIVALRNPISLLNRLDDIAQDIEYVQLSDNVWKIIDTTAKSLGSGFELSERLNRYICNFCTTPNPPGESSCIACGAPLADIQPKTCKKCGYVFLKEEIHCINCGAIV
ncbi:MAG: zinc ribbon domain-containing protein [Chloroflexi bacterium]|nr:zinc ribbon domain-containing protein [Chloroflexota bacterium]